MIIEGLLYTTDHEWLKIEGDLATIGITDYAQQMLGEIIFVELPAIDAQYQHHNELAVAESTKAASDIYSPVAGKVTQVNDELETTPEICKMAITDAKGAETMMDSKKYDEYLKGL